MPPNHKMLTFRPSRAHSVLFSAFANSASDLGWCKPKPQGGPIRFIAGLLPPLVVHNQPCLARTPFTPASWFSITARPDGFAHCLHAAFWAEIKAPSTQLILQPSHRLLSHHRQTTQPQHLADHRHSPETQTQHTADPRKKAPGPSPRHKTTPIPPSRPPSFQS